MKAGTKTHAIETVQFFKSIHPEWWPRLARIRRPDNSWWWYAWTNHEGYDPMAREDEYLDRILS